jgi:hypothetical protein
MKELYMIMNSNKKIKPGHNGPNRLKASKLIKN